MSTTYLGESWLVEEISPTTGDVLYSKTFSSYNEALDVYSEKRLMGTMNTVSIEKCKRTLLQE